MSKEYIEEILKSYYGLNPSPANSIPDLIDPTTCEPINATTYTELIHLIPAIESQVPSSNLHINWPISDLASSLCKDSKTQKVNGIWIATLCGVGFVLVLLMCFFAHRAWKRKSAEERIKERLIAMEEAEERATNGEGERMSGI